VVSTCSVRLADSGIKVLQPDSMLVAVAALADATSMLYKDMTDCSTEKVLYM